MITIYVTYHQKFALLNKFDWYYHIDLYQDLQKTNGKNYDL